MTPMADQNSDPMLLCGLAFIGIGCLVWYLSTRPKTFIRMFVPRIHLMSGARQVLRQGPSWRRGMRIIAILQMLIGLAFVAWSLL